MIAFGPIPSRRLGRSLGINHIPGKACSYSCVYCQVGPTMEMRAARSTFFTTEEVAAAVLQKIGECRASGETIDYLSFVPDGEPTLDSNLGRHIRALLPAGIPIAVITNASLLCMKEVRSDLAEASLVSVKVDTVRPETWRRLNRPHGEIDLDRVLDGIRTFASDYAGTLISDTMLVGSVNDDEDNVGGVADFLAGIAPACAYLGVPTRPPATPGLEIPRDEALVGAYEIMNARLPRVELLPMSEAGTFARTGDPVEGLLAILAVHPMREKAVLAYLDGAATDAPVLLEQMLEQRRLDRVTYRGERFFVRRIVRRVP